MVDYSPLGDCIFEVVFVIGLGNSPAPDVCPPLTFAITRLEIFRPCYIYISRGYKMCVTHSRCKKKKKKKIGGTKLALLDITKSLDRFHEPFPRGRERKRRRGAGEETMATSSPRTKKLVACVE